MYTYNTNTHLQLYVRHADVYMCVYVLCPVLVEQAGTVNAELKSALKTKKSKRSCDVLATNVFCVVLALGLLVLLAVLLMNA
jgi:hypothetical protein